MALTKLDCSEVLSAFQANRRIKTCFLADTAKRLYTLEVIQIQPDNLTIELKAPQGRSSPIDPNQRWTLTIRDQKGAYRAVSTKMLVRPSSLFLVLEDRILFMARRKNIRLTAESRNPIDIRFLHQDRRQRGFLVDFNAEGIGIHVPERIAFAVDDLLADGSFELRSHHVSFDSARIVHIAHLENGMRLGLELKQLSASQEASIHAAFDAWCFSQKASFRVADEG